MAPGDRLPRTGLLLVNLGTPDAPRAPEVRRYLKQFLHDPRVIDIPAIARWLLVNGIILPFRPRKSAAAYRTIWTEQGSPLLLHGQALATAMQERLGPDVPVRLAMRYGNPGIEPVLDEMRRLGVDRLVVCPLYPQYAASSTGSSLEEVFRVVGKAWNVPAVSVVEPFYDHPAFIRALADAARPHLERFGADHLLLSYHGLPVRQVQKSDDTGSHCQIASGCCDRITEANRACYRAHSFATSRALLAALGWDPARSTTSFQSRLGRTPWIPPYTDVLLPELVKSGVRRLAVMTPSFVADCLETLEEVGIRAREDFLEAGGEDLVQIPCLNSDPVWVEALHEILRPHLGAGAREALLAR
ncbi:MAG: ferrochelatase [bacterium]|jgi:ferrochelatase|nr:ferrochelatase [bacterium]